MANAAARPQSVPCGGGAGSVVTFDHSGSHHLDSAHSLVLYKWDFDASDGIDWDNPDYSTTNASDTPTHTYVNHGTYTATLQVVDDSDPVKTDEDQVVITVTLQEPRTSSRSRSR